MQINAPTDSLWMLDLEAHGTSEQWKKLFLHTRMSRFGSINYNNEWLFFFGGFQFSKRRKEFGDSNKVYALRLADGAWHAIQLKLQRKSCFFAVFPEGSAVVHLYTYRGHHYTLEINELTGAVNSTAVKMNMWTEQSKTVLPTKSKSITNMGPKIDDDDTDDEKDDK